MQPDPRLPYADRREAGRVLAAALDMLRGEHPLVLALPRGGVPVAAEIADALHAPLDVLIVRKIGHPSHPEYAIGAIASAASAANGASGAGGPIRVLDEAARAVDPRELQRTIAEEEAELARRERAYRGDARAIEPRGRTVLVVDDGIATGATMEAALRAMRAAGASRIVAAAPVASREACERLAAHADQLVVPAVPEYFRAVGQWYRDFPQCSDDEVMQMLQAHRARRGKE